MREGDWAVNNSSVSLLLTGTALYMNDKPDGIFNEITLVDIFVPSAYNIRPIIRPLGGDARYLL